MKNFNKIAIAIIVGLAFSHVALFIFEEFVPVNVVTWQRNVRAHMISQVESLSQKEFDSFSEVGQSKATEDLPTFKAWLNRYINDDMEPFIRTVVSGLPKRLQHKVWRKAARKDFPDIQLKYEPEVRGSTNRHDTILLNPVLLDSYENLRGTLSHELVHYWVQGVTFQEDTRSLGEGLTQYLTVKGHEDLGWDLSYLKSSSSEDEVDIIKNDSVMDSPAKFLEMLTNRSVTYAAETTYASMLCCLDCKNELFFWYVGDYGYWSAFNPITFIDTLLQDNGLVEVDSLSFKSLSLDLEAHHLQVEKQLRVAKEENSNVDNLFEKHDLLRKATYTKELLTKQVWEHFEKVDNFLKQRDFAPPTKEEWTAFLLTCDDGESEKRQEFSFYEQRILGMLDKAMYSDLPITPEFKDVLEKQFFRNMPQDISRKDVVRRVVERIHLILDVRMIQSYEYSLTDEFLEKTKAIDATLVEFTSSLAKLKEAVQSAEVLFHEASIGDWKIAVLLSEKNPDILKLFQERGMPRYFLSMAEKALAK